MSRPGPSAHATVVPSAGRRIVVIAIGVILAVHSFLVMIWVMPTNPFREAVGDDHVTSYINNPIFPFEQSWSVFAPTPRRVGESIQVRAYYGDPTGTGRYATPFYDITADEDQRIRYLVNPSRFHSATRRLGANINSSVAPFTTQQRQVLALSFLRTPRSRLTTLLEERNTRGAAGEASIEQYTLNDLMLVRYGTMYATARWGPGVTAVEFRVGRRSVPSYSRRNEVDFLDVPFTFHTIGLRKPIPGNADAQEAFDGYVAKAPVGQRLAAEEATSS